MISFWGGVEDSLVNNAAANGARGSSSEMLQEELRATGGAPPPPPVSSCHQVTLPGDVTEKADVCLTCLLKHEGSFGCACEGELLCSGFL